MFRASRIRMIALITCILLAVTGGTMAVIYCSTYAQMNRENREMLETYANFYATDGGPEQPMDVREPPSGEPEPRQSASARRYRLSTFYSVEFSTGDDSVRKIVHDAVPELEESTLESMARSIRSRKRTFGTWRDVVYLVTEGEDYLLVTMMDNTAMGESMSALLRNTAVFGCAAAVLLLGVSVILSGWIIRPLETAYEKQRQFISDAGHELKTPISTISANAELLHRETGENRWLSNIRCENQRMGELVGQLLELTRIEQRATPRQRLDFSKLVLSGVLPFEASAFESGVNLQCEVQEGILLNGSAPELSKLVSVLVDNALEHCNAGGTVEVRLKTLREQAVLTVSNQGTEIPPAQRNQIFERFYRGDAARSESGHYGLGLSIAKAAVQMHRGNISVSCQNGITCFRVTLPLHRAEAGMG